MGMLPTGARGLCFSECSPKIVGNGERVQARIDRAGAHFVVGGNRAFSLRAVSVGVTGVNTIQLAREGELFANEDYVLVSRGIVDEEFFAKQEGPRQDFVVHEKPCGNGDLVLEISVSGASYEVRGTDVVLRLPDGSHVSYQNLCVFDATKRQLSAVFVPVSQDTFAVHVWNAEAVYPVRIDPIVTDSDWHSLWDLSIGSDLSVQLAAYDRMNHIICVGGPFSLMGGVQANRIACFDDVRWSAVGEGLDDTFKLLLLILQELSTLDGDSSQRARESLSRILLSGMGHRGRWLAAPPLTA